MSTQTSSYTYTHAVIYVTDRIMQSLFKIIQDLGLDPSALLDEWPSIERAVKAWTEGQWLEKAILEVYDPSTDKFVRRWDLAVAYDVGGNAEFWADIDAIRYAIRKTGTVPERCQYRVLLYTKSGRPDVEGWGPASSRSTGEMSSHSVGAAAGAGSLGLEVSYWR